MKELKGKTILLLAPDFFGYELEIKKELESCGAKVIYFDERPKNDFFTKAFIRLNLKNIIKKRIDKYYDGILSFVNNEKLDYLFLVGPETVDNKFINTIKNNNNGVKVYTYFWDSIKNKKKSLDYLPVSDKYFTFDSSDQVINKNIKFLPLFYIEDYQQVASIKNEIIYDVSFIGTVHSDRYNLVKKIEKIANNQNLKTFLYFYSPSNILFSLQKLFKKEFMSIDSKDISFKSLSKKDVVNIIGKSKIIIDIQHPKQNGLTMRTMEMLGAKRKIITTNSNIKKYDFYNENNIYIFDRHSPEVDHEFFIKPYEEIDKNIYEKYSLKNWIKTIFG